VFYGPAASLLYFTAYALEKSLSIDNIFVFVLIFGELQIPQAEQRRVLYWGVLSALVMRAIFIALGVFLLERFHWVIYPFAGLILFAAVRILFGQEKEREVVVNACAVCGTWVARIIPITPVLWGHRFWVRQHGRLLATPLLIALILVEITDAVFALDSIPAVFAVTQDPFLIYTSNIFAMLGLRSLYILRRCDLAPALSALRPCVHPRLRRREDAPRRGRGDSSLGLAHDHPWRGRSLGHLLADDDPCATVTAEIGEGLSRDQTGDRHARHRRGLRRTIRTPLPREWPAYANRHGFDLIVITNR
jgi:predicted tellurium resistance membrane protein TerC